MQIFGFLGSLLGYALWAAFYVFHNFGLAIIVFTIVIKAVLFPFSVKQQKSMAGNARMAKKQKELQEKYGVDPRHINFEITETMFDNLGEVMDRNLRELVRMGYSFSLDDYGIGYSNIHRLSKLPLEIIKIDKSLLWGAEKSELGMVILENTIRMICQMKKKILVEGVETLEQIRLLEKLGVDFLQGYYFSKPIPKDDFIKHIEKASAAVR